MRITNPYDSVLKKLSKKNIKYVVIGVFGVNYYAADAGNFFSTQDCDVLVKATPKNLFSALKVLQKEGYNLETNNEPLLGLDLWLTKKIIEHRAVITGRKDKVLRIDIVLEGGKIPYTEWNKNKKFFKVGKIIIPVGNLSQLLRAKENSNREKDRAFLKLYKIQLKEMLKRTN
ncbi:MAG: hypothetical protein Q7K21_02570 [Elusimicrobiota bacterium]|nr:hypothetical protein [Elusimicrobiota bacterium]